MAKGGKKHRPPCRKKSNTRPEKPVSLGREKSRRKAALRPDAGFCFEWESRGALRSSGFYFLQTDIDFFAKCATIGVT